jgi:formate dehydrogenase major subunit
MNISTTFTIDGMEVKASPGESIWEVANRIGTDIPTLCHLPTFGYRPDGNCRVCMVEVKGERVLTSSCNREPEEGMVVITNSHRAETARSLVLELLMADQPTVESGGRSDNEIRTMARQLGQTESRFPGRKKVLSDDSHPAISVNLSACIHCTRCVRACREVQGNDVIGMARRGASNTIVFDMQESLGDSTCVGCGECVQACPTDALIESSVRLDVKPDKFVDSLCPYCGVGCQLRYEVSGNRIVSVQGRDGPANRGRLCIKGRFGFDYVHHSSRLTVPLIRKNGAPKSIDNLASEKSMADQFREASWDEALDFAAEGLRSVLREYGPSALSGFGCAKGSNEEAYLFQKFIRTGLQTNNVDHCTRLCHASSVAALMETIGSGAVTSPFSESLNADVILVVGANPAENHPVAATFFKNAVKSGASLMVMDPRGQVLKNHCKYMVRNKPGTDVAVLNAIMHVIIEEDLYDHEFVKKRTEGFAELSRHLRKFSPNSVAEQCGVDPKDLIACAKTFGEAKNAIIFWGMGISQHIHGTDNARCLIALALLTGQIGRPGTGLHPLRGQNNVQGASDAGLVPMFFPDYRPVSDPQAHEFFEEFWNSKLDSDPGLTVVEIADAAHDGKIKGMYVMGENPAMSDPNLNHVREALTRLEHLVVQDIFLTETAAFADVILPASAFPEKDGTFTNTDRRVQMGRKAIEPPGQVKQDWWIIQELAKRLGLSWNYDGPCSVYNEMRKCMPSIAGITWERLSREGSVTYPCVEEGDPGEDLIFSDSFPTSDGRGRLIAADIISPGEQPDEKYPMVLTTGRQLEHWHTGVMTRRAEVLNNLEPEAVCELSPLDLERLGLTTNGRVRVVSRRGIIELTVKASSATPPGLVFIPFCYAEAAANLLTNPQLDPYGKIPELKFCSVRIESVDSDSEEI